MTFVEQITATFIGAISAFVFSIALFYLTEKWKNSTVNKNLRENLQKEFEYNIAFLEEYKSDFEKLLRKITANDTQIYTIFKFYRLQRLFILEAFNRGLLYQYLTPEDINNVDSMLNYFSNVQDQLEWDRLGKFKEGTLNQQEALRSYEYDKEQIEKYINVQKTLKEKLKGLN